MRAESATIKISFKNERSTKHTYTIPPNDSEENKKGVHFVKQLFKTYDPEKIALLQEAGATRMEVSVGKLTRVTQEDKDNETKEHLKLQEMHMKNKHKYRYNMMIRKRKEEKEAEELLKKKRKAYDLAQKKLKKKKKAKEVSDNLEDFL